VKRFYRYHAALYDVTRWAILHGRQQAIERLDLSPSSRMLEIGCGTGLNFGLILRRLDAREGGGLVGVDFSPDMLRRAERRVASRGWSNVRLVQADATDLRLDETFDAVLFAYSLSMIPAWQTALERAREHLTPGGRIVVLDFGRFRGWGPLAPLPRAWLRWHHVRVDEPYAESLGRLFADITVLRGLADSYFIAAGRRPEA